MRTIKELRSGIDFRPEICSSSVRYFASQNIDWDVYLPTKKMNLQRDFVWTLEQKRELIWSVFLERNIPHCAIINIVDRENPHKDIWQVIDGKQRLSALVDFHNNKFTIEIEGQEYFLKDLPEDYILAFRAFTFRYYQVCEPYEKPITDQQKINWFKLINFAGTAQDAEHLQALSKF